MILDIYLNVWMVKAKKKSIKKFTYQVLKCTKPLKSDLKMTGVLLSLLSHWLEIPALKSAKPTRTQPEP